MQFRISNSSANHAVPQIIQFRRWPEKKINVNSTLPASNPLPYARDWGREERRLLYSEGKPYQNASRVLILLWYNLYLLLNYKDFARWLLLKCISGKIFHANLSTKLSCTYNYTLLQNFFMFIIFSYILVEMVLLCIQSFCVYKCNLVLIKVLYDHQGYSKNKLNPSLRHIQQLFPYVGTIIDWMDHIQPKQGYEIPQIYP